MSETLLRIFECHLAMMNFLARNRRDNRLAHLAPFQGDLWIAAELMRFCQPRLGRAKA